MTAIVQEKAIGTRSRTTKKITRSYVIYDVEDESAALLALVEALPTTRDGLPLDPESPQVDEVNETIYVGSAEWAFKTNECSFSFDISSTTQKITQSKKTVVIYTFEDVTAVDNHGAIGITKGKHGVEVEGCEILVPEFKFTITRTLDDATVTGDYRNTLFGLVDKVNDSTIAMAGQTFDAGELLFTGAAGSLSREGQWEITFNFSGSENVTDLTVGADIDGEGGFGGIAKDGWDYMWVKYQETEDEDANEITKTPEAVYIERVYDRADFSALLICE